MLRISDLKTAGVDRIDFYDVVEPESYSREEEAPWSGCDVPDVSSLSVRLRLWIGKAEPTKVDVVRLGRNLSKRSPSTLRKPMQMDGSWSLWAAPRFTECHYRFLVAICELCFVCFSKIDYPSDIQISNCFNGVRSEGKTSYHFREQLTTAISCHIIWRFQFLRWRVEDSQGPQNEARHWCSSIGFLVPRSVWFQPEKANRDVK